IINLYPLYEVLFAHAVRETACLVAVRAGRMRSLLSQRQNSAQCCFEKCVARPFKGESKISAQPLAFHFEGEGGCVADGRGWFY
ncbi:MAG: hypothetical protein NC033_05550, partial [Clostridiales bacterium]|nr:hypothetical protein [Clostridiales bacterium]